MPRVRLPHASFIASAESPLLPFLAPRLFAESPIPRKSQAPHGKRERVQEEVEKADTYKKRLNSASQSFGTQDSRRSHGSSSPLRQLQDERSAAGLHLLQMTRPQNICAKKSTPSRPIDHLYADISSYARQHARAYTTAASPIRRVEARGRRLRPTRVSSVLAQRGPVLAAKRNKALALEQRRLANYVSRLPPGVGANERNQKGQYRSLRRRIFNLKHWDATLLDLRRPAGETLLDLRRPAHDARAEPGLVRAFATLDRTVYPSVGRHTRRVQIKHDPTCVRLSRKLFTPKAGWAEVSAKWIELDIDTRRTWFERLLVYLLDRAPGRVIRFIRAIVMDPVLRGMRAEPIADALGHLSKIHCARIYNPRGNWSKDPEVNQRSFVPAFLNIFQSALAKQRDVCSQDLLYNIVQLATIKELKRVFDCLVEARTRIGFDTLLHYANAFGEAGETKYALRCLDELKARHDSVAWQAVVDRQRLHWSCATILRKSMTRSKKYHKTPSIIASFVKLGIKIDILLYNVVIHNAMEAGDYPTAFKVYNALEGNGLKADKHTYSILLNGCSSQSSPAMFQRFAQHCAEVAKEIKDPWLATDFLYYLYMRHQNDPEIERISFFIWQTYSDFFSKTSFEEFLVSRKRKGLRDAVNEKRVAQTSALLEPPPMAMYIMLQLEIKTALAYSTQRVLLLYQQFKQLAYSPGLEALTRNPTTWNAFLFAFCQKQQFASASQVIKDMTEGSTKPNIYSWNIFMQAFFKTGQVQAAERVFEIMRSRGVDPDQFTYGVLLRGYAKAQLIERIGDTMQHVKTEQEMDPDLLRALAKVVDRRKLMLALEKSRVEKEARAKEQADKEAEEERQRWSEYDETFSFLEGESKVPAESSSGAQKPLSHRQEQGVVSPASEGTAGRLSIDRPELASNKIP
ncbi:Nn.00g065740.m01.CDS01 [Neocucurbitaria sp. VM-36]